MKALKTLLGYALIHRTALAPFALFTAVLSALLLGSTTANAQNDWDVIWMPPGYGYRIDTRPPREVFRDGFRATGRNRSLMAHVRGESCRAGNDAWVSTTGSISELNHFLLLQMESGQLPDPISEPLFAWVYLIRLEEQDLDVETVFRQAIAAARRSTLGYFPIHAQILEQVIYTNELAPNREVVTLGAILPSRIINAHAVIYQPLRSTVTIDREGRANPNYVPREVAQPGEYTGRADNALLQDLLPVVSINQASLAPDVGQCFQLCDNAGASSASSYRMKRSASNGTPDFCAARPNRAQRLIGADDQ